MVLLTKADILNGKFERQDVYIKLLDKSISLRPLTDGEYNAILAIKKDMGKIKTNIKVDKEGDIDVDKMKAEAQENSSLKNMDMELDMSVIEEKKYLADCKAAAYGLTNDSQTFQVSDVKNMQPIGVVHEIAEAVIKISKLNEPEKFNEDTKSFRDE